MTRLTYIEQIRRLIYNGQPSDDATITVGLVNTWLDQAIAVAAKKNYTDSITLDGVSYVNNSFYTTFKNLSLTQDSFNVWKITLPQIPLGIGQTEGISTVEFVDPFTRQISSSAIVITENQRSYAMGMREIPNTLLCYPRGKYIYVEGTLILYLYTANVTMISGGDNTDLNSDINVPNDYFPVMTDYLTKQLMIERQIPVDVENDGLDALKTT